MNTVQIKQSTLKEVYGLNELIPEFQSNPYTLDYMESRLKDHSPFIIAAFIGGKPVGYSIGYDRFGDGSLYSWVGGVLPHYRKFGIYSAMREFQEKWARKQGFKSIKIKTRNRLVDMRRLLAKLNYVIIDVEKKGPIPEYGLLHEKVL